MYKVIPVKVERFDTQKGIYCFEESSLSTGFHAHPAIEIIRAPEGHFAITTKDTSYSQLTMAVIQANTVHAFDGKSCRCELMLIEPLYISFTSILKVLGTEITDKTVFTWEESSRNEVKTFDSIVEDLIIDEPVQDERIIQCIAFILAHINQDKLLLPMLAKHTHLSASRLSHLFKEKMGLPIQKYISWVRLKLAIELSLQNGTDLQEAALAAGFYDPAHFSRRFKGFFGLKPSAVYNSRIVQD